MESEWILGRLARGCGLDSTGSGYGPVMSCCECGDEPLGSCTTELVSVYSEGLKKATANLNEDSIFQDNDYDWLPPK
jgi:hypothetical protein